MDWVREPHVAGSFYPDGRPALSRMVEDLLKDALAPPPGGAPPKALIAPHAGYVYSGPVAASAYARLVPFRQRYTRVLLLGPAHRHFFRGLGACSASAFRTPLGSVPVDETWRSRALELPGVRLVDEAHEGEHSLEVHLPFLQMVLDEFRILPLVVGDVLFQEVADILSALWGGDETLVVVSSDLSHFLSYERAASLDETTALAIEGLQPEEIGHDRACGRIPMGGLLLRAREEGLEVERVDLRSSGDTAGPRDRVVGYGAFLFS